MSRTIAITTQKGGVAKTTTTANLAAAWGGAGKKVLVVDMDPQFGLTGALGVDPGGEGVPGTAVDLFQGDALEGVVMPEILPGVDLVAGHRNLRSVELTLADKLGRETFLREALKEAKRYDLVLIDCPPTLNLLTVNALMAANEAVVPVSMQDRGAYQGALEVAGLLPDLKRIGGKVKIKAVVKVKANPSRVMYGSISDALEAEVEAGHFPVAETEIPDRADFNNAMGWGRPLVVWRPHSPGARAYIDLAHELDGNRVQLKAAA